jgi:hypothetical protein
MQVIDQHKPEAVAMRYPEPLSRGGGDAARRRCRLEGVLLEAAASRDYWMTACVYVFDHDQLRSRVPTAPFRSQTCQPDTIVWPSANEPPAWHMMSR